MNRSMINAASGGALINKTLTEARNLISNMASNSQQFNIPNTEASKGVKEVSTTELQQQLSQLTSIVQ